MNCSTKDLFFFNCLIQLNYFCTMKYLYLLLLFSISITKLVLPQQIVINEFMSSNATTIQDSDGDFSDWIELYNSGNGQIDLEGFMISDDMQEPDKWIFPSVVMMPGSYLLIFASDKDRYDPAELHTNFKIKASGEDLILSKPDTTIADHLDPVSVSTDVSYGRFPDGGVDLTFMTLPSPGSQNIASSSVLTVSASGGFYNTPFKTGLSSSVAGDTIYYTLDGSVPNMHSNVYSDSILMGFTHTFPNTISTIPTGPDSLKDQFRKWSPPAGWIPKANVLRAAAFNNGVAVSEIITNTYFVDSNLTEQFPYHIVSINTDSINLFGFEEGIYVPGTYFDSSDPDWTGNYFQNGDQWERPIHFEYFDDSGNRVLNLPAGTRVHGKITRHGPQKTLRLYSYCAMDNLSFKYPFMLNSNQEEFKRILLRTSYADGSQTIFKDAMIHDVVKDFNLEMLHFRPVIVFINGEYWGLHTIRERIDKYYISSLYDVDPDNLDILENCASPEEGSADDYNNMINFIENNDLEEDDNYDYIKTRMDVDNFIDYQIVEIFFSNTDWPGSNIRYWREREPDAKWRWILFDLDNACYDYNFNSIEFATAENDSSWQNPPWSTFLLRNLLKNENFTHQFLDRFAFHLNHAFQSESLLLKVEEFVDLYDPGMDTHIARWNFPLSHQTWLNDVGFVYDTFFENRPCAITEIILEYFDLSPEEFGFVCGTNIEKKIKSNIALFPNPAHSTVRVKIPDWHSDNARLEVINQNGQIIIYQKLHNLLNSVDVNLDISALKPGIYFLRILGEKQSMHSKLIKTK